ncbi:transcription factor Spi-B isoform X1 [Synchiropus splendidus]|uniref:transcription factor Spi-B isoform X1 n=1 Tax=Synchiropus splendidus TaxID=270530 RepID=UPI00237D3D0C|nr:transcription factor Spi-B isoform X1 [Synchiropus splendidus]
MLDMAEDMAEGCRTLTLCWCLCVVSPVYWTEDACTHDGSVWSGDCGPLWTPPVSDLSDLALCEPMWKVENPVVFQEDVKPDPQALLASPRGLSDSHAQPSTATASKHPANTGARGGKVRLFHFLFEMLEDPTMAHCVSWVPASAGVFRFSSRNKDQLAALWGQRKGNKRPMTYQKMSRALRNYARSGEIFKVKKKLTYKFSESTLMLLHQCHRGES